MPYKEFDVNGIGKVKIYKRRGSRSLRLTVTADGEIRVSIPYWTPYQAGVAFTVARRGWILAQDRQASSLLVNGMPVGKTRRLVLQQDITLVGVKTSVRAKEVVVRYGRKYTANDPAVQAAAESACWRALKSEALQLLTPRLNELATRYDFTFRSIAVKRMKTRWGSCDQHRNIVFNIFLMQLPWDCIDYVILHELTHTHVLHHGPDFWQAMESVLPGARKFKRTMRAYRPTLITQNPKL